MLSISQAADILGVCTKTLRRWEKKGIITPDRTPGGHRRYDREALIAFIETGTYAPKREIKTGKAALYCRVSSHKQKADLERQAAKLERIARKDGFHPILYKDIGSGMNDNRRSFIRFIRDAYNKKFDKVYISHLDRLARFGTRPLHEILTLAGIPLVEVMAPENKSFERKLIESMTAMMYSFTAKIDRRRRGENTITEA